MKRFVILLGCALVFLGILATFGAHGASLGIGSLRLIGCGSLAIGIGAAL